MTIVFKVSDNVKEKMIKYYNDLKREKTPPYAIFQAQEADTIITLYESGKVMFQGVCADIDANIWIDLEKKLNNRIINIKTGKEKKKTDKQAETISRAFDKYNTIGSDEVGTGDYFGPIVVAATFVAKENIEFLNNLKVTDSKALSDDYIIKIAPQIMEKIPYNAFILNNESYNKFYNEDLNMNKIKAILHNKVLYNMVSKNYNYDKIVVDEFAPSYKYYSYLNDVSYKVTNITFVQKAESKCLSVACASIICRYIFLKSMNEMSKELGSNIPKGAGITVDEFAKNLVKEKGFDILNKYVKLNFKNTQKIKEFE